MKLYKSRAHKQQFTVLTPGLIALRLTNFYQLSKNNDDKDLYYHKSKYVLMYYFVCFPVSQNMKRTGYFTDTQRKAQKSVRRRFFLIVFVFALW